MTPAEIFQPFYGHAVAAALLEKLPQKQPLDIIEVGGGSGRLARDVLVGFLSSAVTIGCNAVPAAILMHICRTICMTFIRSGMHVQATPLLKSAQSWQRCNGRRFCMMASIDHVTKWRSMTPARR